MVTHSKLSEHREERSVSIRFLEAGTGRRLCGRPGGMYRRTHWRIFPFSYLTECIIVIPTGKSISTLITGGTSFFIIIFYSDHQI